MTENRRDRCFYIGADQMDGRGFRADLDAVLVALADDHRLLQRDLSLHRADDAIALHPHRLQGILYLLIFLFHFGQLPHRRNELIFPVDGRAGELAECPVIVGRIKVHLHLQGTRGQIHGLLLHGADEAALGREFPVPDIPHLLNAIHVGPDIFQQILLDLMALLQHFHPFGDVILDLLHREFIEHLLQQPVNILFFHLLAVHA